MLVFVTFLFFEFEEKRVENSLSCFKSWLVIKLGCLDWIFGQRKNQLKLVKVQQLKQRNLWNCINWTKWNCMFLTFGSSFSAFNGMNIKATIWTWIFWKVFEDCNGIGTRNFIQPSRAKWVVVFLFWQYWLVAFFCHWFETYAQVKLNDLARYGQKKHFETTT